MSIRHAHRIRLHERLLRWFKEDPEWPLQASFLIGFLLVFAGLAIWWVHG